MASYIALAQYCDVLCLLLSCSPQMLCGQCYFNIHIWEIMHVTVPYIFLQIYARWSIANILLLAVNIVTCEPVYYNAFHLHVIHSTKDGIHQMWIIPQLNKNVGKYNLPHLWDGLLQSIQELRTNHYDDCCIWYDLCNRNHNSLHSESTCA